MAIRYDHETLTVSVLQLEVKDSTPVEEIARTHEKTMFGSQRHASLQVSAAGMPLLDLIVITWVYVESKMRQDSE